MRKKGPENVRVDKRELGFFGDCVCISWQVLMTSEEDVEVRRIMPQGLGSDGVPAAGSRLWLTDLGMETGILPVFSHSEAESASEGLAANDGFSPMSWHGDGRKRKELSAGATEEDSGAFNHKRHRQEHTQSSASSSYGSVVTSGTDALSCNTIAERQSSVLSLLAPMKQPVLKEQGRATGVLELAEMVDTSCWSADGRHDEISGVNTSTFTSSEEGDSQLHQSLGRFLDVSHKGDVSIGPNGRARTHMWSDSGGLLSLWLDSFIEKEKEKIESSDTAGSGAQSLSKSEWSLSGSLHGIESSSSQKRPFEGSSTDIVGSCSVKDASILLARMCSQARSQGGSRLEIVESDPVNSMLLSCLNKQQRSTLGFCQTEDSVLSGMEGQGKEERKRILTVQNLSPVSMSLQGPICGLPGVQLSSTENMRIQDEDGMRTHDVHQTFVLSSGRPSSTEVPNKDALLNDQLLP